jgi:hypothetical protein
MAIISKDGKSVDIELGYKKCKVISYEANGRKVIKKEVFEQGYITFELEDGTVVKQYMLIVPWNKYLFYKLIKAVKGNINITDECEHFDYQEIVGKEVVIELVDEEKDTGIYTNITNIYNIEEGEVLIDDDKKRKEKMYAEMEKKGQINMNYIKSKISKSDFKNDIDSIEEESSFNNENKFDTEIDFGDMEHEDINF